MMETTSIKLLIEKSKSLKSKPKDDKLGFGKEFTDHMLIRKNNKGTWGLGNIIPFESLPLSPASAVFHYGQALFEGLKAFRQNDGNIAIFRPDQNAKRLNNSARRLAMPTLDEEFFVQSLRELINLEKEWVPSKFGTSLYIRPTMIAIDHFIGVKPSENYLYFVILSPSGPYFANGFQPTKILVENNYIRAAKGGTGFIKAAGNYAGSMLATQNAKEQGYDQVLWLDSIHRKYIEEIGAMNIGFVIDDKVYSPKPNGTILDGITRKSVLQLCIDLGIQFVEDPLSIGEVTEKIDTGNLTEIFGIGTAASIAPIGEINYNNKKYIINDSKVGPIATRLYKELTGIQYGYIEDRHGWMLQCD